MNGPIKLAALAALTVVAAAAVGRIQSHAPAPPPSVEAKELPALAMFAAQHFAPGLYQLSAVDTPQRQASAACIARPEQLVRLHHAAVDGCNHLVVENLADRATVQYECPAQGWGRTSIRATDSGGFKVEIQGINGREPFAETLNVHRTGACRTAAPR